MFVRTIAPSADLSGFAADPVVVCVEAILVGSDDVEVRIGKLPAVIVTIVWDAGAVRRMAAASSASACWRLR